MVLIHFLLIQAGEIWEDSAKVRAFLSLKLDRCSPYDVMQGSTNEDEGGIQTWLDTIREKVVCKFVAVSESYNCFCTMCRITN